MRSIVVTLSLAVLALAACVTASAQKASTPSAAAPTPEFKQRPIRHFRLGEVRTAADVDKLKDLNADELAIARANLKRIPDTDGWNVVSNDPELANLWHIIDNETASLLDGDNQAIPFGPMSLLSLAAAKNGGNDYVYNVFIAWMTRQIDVYHLPQTAAAKLGVIDNPDSKLWTDQERLVLKFAYATLQNKMTDALFDQARAAWGDKKILRYVTWASYVQMWSNVSNAAGLHFEPDMVPAKGTPQEHVQAILKQQQAERRRLRTFVDKTGEYADR